MTGRKTKAIYQKSFNIQVDSTWDITLHLLRNQCKVGLWPHVTEQGGNNPSLSRPNVTLINYIFRYFLTKINGREFYSVNIKMCSHDICHFEFLLPQKHKVHWHYHNKRNKGNEIKLAHLIMRTTRKIDVLKTYLSTQPTISHTHSKLYYSIKIQFPGSVVFWRKGLKVILM